MKKKEYKKCKEGSYLHNVEAITRKGDGHLFKMTEDGSILASLNGYQIMPIEDYWLLQDKADGILRAIRSPEGEDYNKRANMKQAIERAREDLK